jgi:hypothetical protein
MYTVDLALLYYRMHIDYHLVNLSLHAQQYHHLDSDTLHQVVLSKVSLARGQMMESVDQLLHMITQTLPNCCNVVMYVVHSASMPRKQC